MTDREGQEEAKKQGKPWTRAKGWDTSCPVSEMVPTASVAASVGDYRALNLWLSVNGVRRQYGSTARMIFDVPTLIAEVSRVHTLEPWDLLLTGTPEGVGAVAPGDVITAGIKEVGVEITVPVVEALSLP